MKNYNLFKDFKIEPTVTTDTGIQLKRVFSFTYYLYGVYKIMEHIDRFNGLNNIISLREMVQAYDGWTGEQLKHTYLDRCNFILNFNSTAERDAAIPVLKKLCRELRIPISRYVKQGTLLNEMLHTKQTTLDMYFKSENNV